MENNVRQEFGKEAVLEDILTKERQCHQKFFSREFDLASFRTTLEEYGLEEIIRWQELGLEPHYLPPVAMHRNASFPGWKVRPKELFYRRVAAGEILRRKPDGELVPDLRAFELEGITVLVDIRLKPQYEDGKQMFSNDNLLGPIIEELRKKGKIVPRGHDPQSSRFGVSIEEWRNQVRPKLAEFLDVQVSQVRLERVIEANVIPQLYPYMPRRNDGNTNTWVWYEECFSDASHQLNGGCSAWGGLACVDYGLTEDIHWYVVAVRPLIVLSSSEWDSE